MKPDRFPVSRLTVPRFVPAVTAGVVPGRAPTGQSDIAEHGRRRQVSVRRRHRAIHHERAGDLSCLSRNPAAEREYEPGQEYVTKFPHPVPPCGLGQSPCILDRLPCSDPSRPSSYVLLRGPVKRFFDLLRKTACLLRYTLSISLDAVNSRRFAQPEPSRNHHDRCRSESRIKLCFAITPSIGVDRVRCLAARRSARVDADFGSGIE